MEPKKPKKLSPRRTKRHFQIIKEILLPGETQDEYDARWLDAIENHKVILPPALHWVRPPSKIAGAK